MILEIAFGILLAVFVLFLIAGLFLSQRSPAEKASDRLLDEIIRQSKEQQR